MCEDNGLFLKDKWSEITTPGAKALPPIKVSTTWLNIPNSTHLEAIVLYLERSNCF